MPSINWKLQSSGEEGAFAIGVTWGDDRRTGPPVLREKVTCVVSPEVAKQGDNELVISGIADVRKLVM